MKKIIIYTDGACSGNPGPGGWGALLMYSNVRKEIYGSCIHTTNNRMEMMAAIKAIEFVKESCIIDLYTDSKYLKDGMTSWIHVWKKNNWHNSNKELVKNVDLWKELDILNLKHKINWIWVQAHSGNIENEIVDKLAVKGRDIAVKTL